MSDTVGNCNGSNCNTCLCYTVNWEQYPLRLCRDRDPIWTRQSPRMHRYIWNRSTKPVNESSHHRRLTDKRTDKDRGQCPRQETLVFPSRLVHTLRVRNTRFQICLFNSRYFCHTFECGLGTRCMLWCWLQRQTVPGTSSNHTFPKERINHNKSLFFFFFFFLIPQVLLLPEGRTEKAKLAGFMQPGCNQGNAEWNPYWWVTVSWWATKKNATLSVA